MSATTQASSAVARRTGKVTKPSKASTSAARPRLLIPGIPRHTLEQGRSIYAYKHFQTNQVVYSLTRVLNNNSALKQLPFAGKLSLPTALRKDHWAPYFTVRFPIAAQGLRAFKKLREWRKLHEYSWDEPDLAKFLNKQRPLDAARDKGKRDGVTEKTASWKRLARKRTRRRMINTSKFIQDQKANSVADLAAVLLDQRIQSDKWEQTGLPRVTNQLNDIARMLSDPDLRTAKLKQLEENRAELLKWRAAIKKPIARGRKAKQEAHDEYVRRSKPLKDNGTLAFRLAELESAVKTLFQRKMRNLRIQDPEAFEILQQERIAPATVRRLQLTSERRAKNGDQAERTAIYEELAAPLRTSTDSVTLESPGQGAGSNVAAKPNGLTWQLQLADNTTHNITVPWQDTVVTVGNELLHWFGYKSRPTTLDGVKIEWASLPDHQLAESWPEHVEHEPMGFLKRNAVRSADDPERFEVQDKYGYDEAGNMIVANGSYTRLGLRLKLGVKAGNALIALGRPVAEETPFEVPGSLLLDDGQPQSVFVA